MLVADITSAARAESSVSRTRPLLVIAFALSGVAGLILEVAWFRRLGVAGGAVAGAAGVITAAYMGGLALGNWIGGRLSSHTRERLWLYGAAEAVVALSALLVPKLLSPVGPDSGLVSWLGLGALLMIPTTAMGMGLPLVASTLESTTSGRVTAFLYAVNTAGAALGVSWAGFWGLPRLGPAAVDAVAASIQLLVVLLVAFVAWRLPQASSVREDAARTLSGHRPPPSVLLGAAFASGAAMVVQVSWTELAVKRLGGLGEGFSITVLAFIAGLSAGGFLAMQLLRRIVNIQRTVAAMLGVTAASLLIAWLSLPGGSSAWMILAPLLPMTVAGGTLFPLFVAISTHGGAPVGVSVGTTGAASTLGAISGSLGAIAILPAVGAATSLAGCFAVYGGLCALFVWRSMRVG